MAAPDILCACKDPNCPMCEGDCAHFADTTVFRIDMADQTGTPMCDRCAEDASNSGLF